MLKRLRKFFRQNRNKSYFSDPFQHKRMLADEIRCSMYETAIQHFIKKHHTVLDVGTGSGFLSRCASQYADHVWAIDRNDTFNLVSNENITYLQRDSTGFDIPIDVIVHELFGSYLFNEDTISIVADLRDRCLKQGGIILPMACSLYVSPVKIKERFRVFLKKDSFEKLPFQAYEAFLEEQHLLSVDFMSVKKTYCTENIKTTVEIQTPVDGFCLFFKADFGDGIKFENRNELSSWYLPFFHYPLLKGRHTVQVLINNICDGEKWKINMLHCSN